MENKGENKGERIVLTIDPANLTVKNKNGEREANVDFGVSFNNIEVSSSCAVPDGAKVEEEVNITLKKYNSSSGCVWCIEILGQLICFPIPC